MKNRNGFTLAEMLIAVLIFGFIAMSLATISSTANRNMFQNYRKNVLKTNVLVSMRDIQNTLSMATRIDSPPPGAQSDFLAFAVNVDQLSGCYPVSAANPATWHYFCMVNDPLISGSRVLYHHWGTLPAGTPCGTTGATFWGAAYPVPVCGANLGGQTVTLLLRNASMGIPFSRSASDGIYENGTVRVTLRALWSAAGRSFGTTQRDVDFRLDTVINVNRGQ